MKKNDDIELIIETNNNENIHQEEKEEMDMTIAVGEEMNRLFGAVAFKGVHREKHQDPETIGDCTG